MNIQEIRQKYPQYDDLPDEQLLQGIHAKHYPDIPFDEFAAKVAPAALDPGEIFQKSGDVTTDVIATMGSGMLAEPVAGLAGLGAQVAPYSLPGMIAESLGYEIPEGADVVKSVRDTLTLKPRTEAGGEALESMGETLQPVDRAIRGARSYLGNKAYDLTDSPAAAAVATAIPDAALALTGLKFGRGGARMATKGKAKKTAKGIDTQIAEAVPSQSTLKNTSAALYKQIDDAGVTVKPKPFESWRARLNAKVKKEGMFPGTTDKSVSAMKAINNVDVENLPMSDLLSLRKIAQNAASTLDKADQRIAIMIIDEIDDFIDHANTATLRSPNIHPSEIGVQLNKARELWGREARSETLQRALEKAAQGRSGFENGIRVEVGKLLRNDKKMKYFKNDPAAMEALKQIDRGTFKGNLYKTMGKMGFYEEGTTHFLGGSVGMAGGAAIATGLGLPPLVGAVVVPLFGQVSKNLALRLTKQNAAFADRVIRAGKDAKKITAAYNQMTPLAERTAAELSELLVHKSINLSVLKKAGLELEAAALATERRAALAGALAATQATQ